MEEVYPTVIIKVIGESAPFQYEVSLKGDINGVALGTQAADITTGNYHTVEDVIACFEWDLPERLQELIRENLTNATGVDFNLQDAYSLPE